MELHCRAGDRVALVDKHHRDETPPLGVCGVPGDLKGVYLVVVEISPFRGAGVSAGADEGFDVAPPDIAGFTHRAVPIGTSSSGKSGRMPNTRFH